MLRLVARIAFVALLFVLAGCLGRLEQSLVYQPQRYPHGDWEPADISFSDAWFYAEDGTLLHGWYVPHPDPVGVLLFTHGNAGNVTGRANLVRRLNRDFRLSVMAFDYRGYGKSKGTPSESGILQDARAARSWLARRYDTSEQEIILMGRSLGGAVAVDLAADGARGLILQNTFTSLPDVAQQHVSLVPAKWIMRNRLNSLKRIAQYTGPLLQSHATADRVIPYGLGQKLFDAAPSAQKRFIEIDGAGHNDSEPAEYWIALGEFLNSLPD